MANSDYGSLGELHPDYAKHFGGIPETYEEKRAARAAASLMGFGAVNWDDSKVEPEEAAIPGAMAQRRQALFDMLEEMRVEFEAGRIPQSEWIHRLKVLHDTEGMFVNLCFHCNSVYHPWEMGEDGEPMCGPRAEGRTYAEFMGQEGRA